MTECIDRDKMIAEIDDCFPANPTSEFSKGVAVGLAMAKVAVNHTPTANVRPVVKARWVYTNTSRLVCSNCGNPVAFSLKEDGWHHGDFCPNCGARMGEN